MIPTAVGVAPYVGINFAAYEALRGVITPPGKETIARKLSCGALAGELISGIDVYVGCSLMSIVCSATDQERSRRR